MPGASSAAKLEGVRTQGKPHPLPCSNTDTRPSSGSSSSDPGSSPLSSPLPHPCSMSSPDVTCMSVRDGFWDHSLLYCFCHAACDSCVLTGCGCCCGCCCCGWGCCCCCCCCCCCWCCFERLVSWSDTTSCWMAPVSGCTAWGAPSEALLDMLPCEESLLLLIPFAGCAFPLLCHSCRDIAVPRCSQLRLAMLSLLCVLPVMTVSCCCCCCGM